MNDTQHAEATAFEQLQHAPAPMDVMPLTGHLRELRNRLAVSVLALAVTTVVGWLAHDWLLEQITGPACALPHVHGVGRPTRECPNGLLVNTGILSPLSLSFKVAVTAGFVMAAPVWSYQLWAFVAPGLYKQEKRYGLGFTAAAVPLFCLGGYLAYVVFPKALEVLAGFNPHAFSLSLPGDEFLDFLLRMVLVFGLSFELPLLLVLLNFLGIFSAAALRRRWQVIVFSVFVFAAVATPTGDPITMTALAVPISLLFLLALAVATVHDRAKTRRRAADPDNGLGPDEASVLDPAPSLVGAAGPHSPQPVHNTDPEVVQPTAAHPDDTV
ncbi:twin-arginine translocase subunit TatC [Streptomyces sp. CA-106131]|uniref:twin-arginine translocase subunit TatC n=1 Tax=Streptomyces sp. CA-106131 TaxID=3240045 RepID=UPI003D8F7E41